LNVANAVDVAKVDREATTDELEENLVVEVVNVLDEVLQLGDSELHLVESVCGVVITIGTGAHICADS